MALLSSPSPSAGNGDVVEAGKTGFEPAQGLLEAFGEGAADRHDLADRLHRRRQRALGAGEFFEGEARDLGDHVVDRRLEGGGRRAAGDVVFELVERVADGEPRGDLGDREAGRLRGERGGARHARVHFDDDETAGLGIDGELDIGTAGLDPDFAQNADGGVAHDLVFLVGQGQRRGDGDRIAGMDAHRIDVLDGADDDAIVRAIADDLHLEFLPAEHRFLDENLGRGGCVEAALDDVEELGAVVGDAAAGATQREGGADDGRQADMIERLGGDRHGVAHIALLAVCLTELPGGFELVEGRIEFVAGKSGLQLVAPGLVAAAVLVLGLGRVGEHGAGRLEADPGHRLAEERAVLRLVDGFGVRPDHLDAVAVEYAHAAERQRRVEGRLAAHRGKQRVGALLGDDLCHHLGRYRFDIGGVRQLRVRHDGGRIGVDQDDAVALRFQRLAGLGAGIVELAGLADDDRPCADYEDRLDVRALGHAGGPSVVACTKNRAGWPGRVQ